MLLDDSFLVARGHCRAHWLTLSGYWDLDAMVIIDMLAVIRTKAVLGTVEDPARQGTYLDR